MSQVKQVHSNIVLVSRTGKAYAWPMAATERYMALLQDDEMQRLMRAEKPSRELMVARGTELLARVNAKDKCWFPALAAVARAVDASQETRDYSDR